jgi:phage terminase large subunit-like protein
VSFDRIRANAALNFFERILKHTKGQFAGKHFELLNWEAQIISDLFGTVEDDGRRQYQTAYIEVPKKNGKSELAAGIALYCLLADNEPGAEVYSAATSRDQASLVFRVAASMVEQSEALSKRLRVLRSTKTILKRGDPDSFYRAISADGDVQDGINPHCVIADELHRWKVGKALDLWEILERGTIARRQPLVFAITTAGIQDESPLCWRYHEYERQIREGVFSDRHFYGRVFAAGPQDDWTDERTWIKANPSHEANGGFIKATALRKEFDKAINDPAQQPAFKRFHLCIWGQSENRALDMQKWNACGGELRALIGRSCYGGLDLSTSIDLTAFVLMFPSDDGSFDVLPFFWMPADNIRVRELKDKVPYSQWVKDGYITATPGNQVDYSAVREKIRWAAELFGLLEVDFDPYQATETAQMLIDEGINCVPIKQGFSNMSAPTKRLIELVIAGKIRHANHPVLRWNADCLAVKGDGNDQIRPVKPERATSSKRIDGVVAMINALARQMTGESNIIRDSGVRSVC